MPTARRRIRTALAAEHPGAPLAGCEFVAFDLETTGLHPHCHRIVELGAVRFRADGKELARFNQLVNPGCPMPWAATAVNGIDDRMLCGQPPLAAVLPQFLEFLGPPQTILMAHNAPFDLGFLRQALSELALPPPPHRVVDTMLLAQMLLPSPPNYKLHTLASLLGLPAPEHRSLGDALVVMQLFLELARRAPSWLDEHALLDLASCTVRNR